MTHTERSPIGRRLTAGLAAAAFGLAAWPYVAGAVGAGPFGAAASDKSPSATFDRITAERIDIVDPDGTLRLAIANGAYPPDVRYRGETYSKRSIDGLAGIVFYEADGDETGGVALARLRDNNQTALIFDYTHQLTDGVGIVKRESDDGDDWMSGLFISDRRPYKEGRIESSQGVERIWLRNENRTAALVISDPDGRTRIRIAVDESGEPSIEMFDAAGERTYAAPFGGE